MKKYPKVRPRAKTATSILPYFEELAPLVVVCSTEVEAAEDADEVDDLVDELEELDPVGVAWEVRLEIVELE